MFAVDRQHACTEIPGLAARVVLAGSAASGAADLLHRLHAARPDVVTVEVAELAHGPEVFARLITTAIPDCVLLALTGSTSTELAVRAAVAGFDGWVAKEAAPGILTTALETVLAGACWFSAEQVAALVERLRAGSPAGPLASLTGREHEVLAALSTGESTPTIAKTLLVSEHTVRTHRRHIFRKLGVHNALEAANIARSCGISTGRKATG